MNELLHSLGDVGFGLVVGLICLLVGLGIKVLGEWFGSKE